MRPRPSCRPPGYQPAPEILEIARSLARRLAREDHAADLARESERQRSQRPAGTGDAAQKA